MKDLWTGIIDYSKEYSSLIGIIGVIAGYMFKVGQDRFAAGFRHGALSTKGLSLECRLEKAEKRIRAVENKTARLEQSFLDHRTDSTASFARIEAMIKENRTLALAEKRREQEQLADLIVSSIREIFE